MRTCTKNERGGILLELIIFVLILLVAAAGGARVHLACGKRFRSIVDARNSAIRQIRAGQGTP